MSTIVIETGGLKLPASLNHSETAKRILEALPFEGKADVWGDEIYCSSLVLPKVARIPPST
jgi:hypothetical protein